MEYFFNLSTRIVISKLCKVRTNNKIVLNTNQGIKMLTRVIESN